jgi:hypothetical protein
MFDALPSAPLLLLLLLLLVVVPPVRLLLLVLLLAVPRDLLASSRSNSTSRCRCRSVRPPLGFLTLGMTATAATTMVRTAQPFHACTQCWPCAIRRQLQDCVWQCVCNR